MSKSGKEIIKFICLNLQTKKFSKLAKTYPKSYEIQNKDSSTI